MRVNVASAETPHFCESRCHHNRTPPYVEDVMFLSYPWIRDAERGFVVLTVSCIQETSRNLSITATHHRRCVEQTFRTRCARNGKAAVLDSSHRG